LAEVLDAARRGEAQISQRRLLTALRQVALALHYAHEQGIVHRDVKPSNIMFGAYGEVYLLDWGVALEVASASDNAHGLVGSLVTMSPEQARGDAVDARTDVYALGAVLFEMLTLEPLHPRGDREAILTAIEKGVDARPSVRCPEVDVPPELEAICVEATAPMPHRTPSALALSRAIDAYLDGDRDQEARSRVAQRHAQNAQNAAQDALSGARPEAREAALRELGKVLALRPDDREALTLLARLLTSPPAQVPPAVLRASTAVRNVALRNAGLVAGALYLVAATFAIVGRSSGAPGARSAVQGLFVLAALAAGALVLRPSYATLFACYLTGLVASCSLTLLLGPFVVFVPMLLVLHAALYSFADSRPLRRGILVTSILGWTLCAFGHHLGLLPQTVFYEAGQLIVRTPAVAFSATVSPLYFYLGITAVLLSATALTGRMRTALTHSDLALRLQAWQLSQLAGDPDPKP
jgi:serine/threonine-protein kinase